jgi:hypothetical protein
MLTFWKNEWTHSRVHKRYRALQHRYRRSGKSASMMFSLVWRMAFLARRLLT